MLDYFSRHQTVRNANFRSGHATADFDKFYPFLGLTGVLLGQAQTGLAWLGFGLGARPSTSLDAAQKLGELGAYLKHCMSLPQPRDFERAIAVQQNLASLHGELNRLITDYIGQDDIQNPAGPSQSAPPSSHPPPSTPLPTQVPGSQRRGRKRTVLDIMDAHRRLRTMCVAIIARENAILARFRKRESFGWAVYPQQRASCTASAKPAFHILRPNSNIAEFKLEVNKLSTTCLVYSVRQASFAHTLPRYAIQAEDPFQPKGPVSFMRNAEGGAIVRDRRSPG
jgi:hypothetical protein